MSNHYPSCVCMEILYFDPVFLISDQQKVPGVEELIILCLERRPQSPEQDLQLGSLTSVVLKCNSHTLLRIVVQIWPLWLFYSFDIMCELNK